MLKKGFKLCSFVFLGMLMFFSTTLNAFADVGVSPDNSMNKKSQKRILPSVTFDLNDLKTHTDTVILNDGTKLTVGAEPVVSENSGVSRAAALSGTWRIWGENGLARMEYYIVLKPTYSGSKYTRINNTYGLAVTGRLSSYSDEKIRMVRANETATYGAVVEGYARFNYFGNQWISIWTQSGGVRATVKGGQVTTKLY